jgi:hypothetical protein
MGYDVNLKAGTSELSNFGNRELNRAYQLNLRAIAAEAFGYARGAIFTRLPKAEKDTLESEVNPAYNPNTDPEKEGLVGLLGLPMFATIDIHDISWQEGDVMNTARGMVLMDPIVEVELNRNIVTTEITGSKRSGTVKEFINNGDYAVTIKGVLASDPFTDAAKLYPKADVVHLRKLTEAPVAWPVSGRLMNVFGIKNLVCKRASWRALPGYENLQAYELQCLSDLPIELGGAGVVKR